MTGTHIYAGPTPPDLARLPLALLALPQWVLWRGANKVNETTGEITLNKIPINPHTLGNASSMAPQTWGMFDACVAALPVALAGWEFEDVSAYRGGGLGFVFTRQDPYAGIDLDHCVDPGTRQIADWAQAIVEAIASYTEVTPSQTGLHLLVESPLPAGGRKKGRVEVYDQGRFFTMTGWHVPHTPRTIEPRQDAVARLHVEVFGVPIPPAPQPRRRPSPVALDDAALVAKARTAKNGAKFSRLWDGDTSLHGDDESSADLALCEILAFWTQDAAQIDRLFRASALMRDKWEASRGQETYGERTIAKALALQSDSYHPPAPDEDDPATHAGVVGHRLPDHLRRHPDPRVRQHWQRLYRQANTRKYQLTQDPYARVLASPPEGATP
jgi:putative DNA primase/helicase